MPASANSDPYANIAAWYDLEHDGFSADIEAISELLDGGRERLAILEIGAGTGRIMAALAQAGHVVTGIEPSAAMRARGERRLATLPASVAKRARFIEGTATAPGLAETDRFDVALVGLGTFGHITTAADRAAALHELSERLKPGGLLILDVDIAGPRRLLETAGQVWRQGSWREASGRIVTHWMVGAPGTEPGTVEVTHLYDAHEQGGPIHRTLSTMSLALLTRGEVHLIVTHANFRDMTIYGGYDLIPADDQSARAIVVAKR